ncbi:unnamed protein product [Rotaria socialis]
MAKAAVINPRGDLKVFTDCMYFINGNCKSNDKCRYRHCEAAAKQTNNCFRWPKVCRDAKCPYRHPATPKQGDQKKKTVPEPPIVQQNLQQPVPTPARRDGLISFFWDIENVPIPKGQKPFDIVQRIRDKLVVQSGLREYSFSCYCNSTTISQENQLSLFHANVRIVHIPDRKPGAVDRQIMLELDRFERAHQPPATIVLISGDIDFVGKLSDLRHQAGFHVIVIHNKPAKTELKATVNSHYPWETFTKSVNETDSRSELLSEGLGRRTPLSYRTNNQAATNHQRKTDPSPMRSTPPPKAARPAATGKKRMYECPKCSSEFESVQALRQHQDAKDHLFDCPQCDETFVTLDGLSQHQKAKGHEEVEYICEQCSRRFAKIDSLKQHQQATNHNAVTNEVPFMAGHMFPPASPNNKQVKNDIIQDAAMIVIQRGIDALVEYYPKIFPSNK